MNYAKALSSIKPDKTAARGMTREQIEAAIRNISDAMRRPMPDIERALLYADRADLRAGLADLPKVSAS